MKGIEPVRTVEDLIQYLQRCPPQAEVLLMPEEGDGFHIGGVLEFTSTPQKEVWLLIDEFGGGVEPESVDWSKAYEQRLSDDDEDAAWDAAVAEDGSYVCEPVKEKEDVVQIRGKLRLA